MEQGIDLDKIKSEAKEIIDRFANSLEKVEKEKDFKATYIVRINSLRTEKEATDDLFRDDDFKKRILKNAPKKDSDFILAEKGEWKK